MVFPAVSMVSSFEADDDTQDMIWSRWVRKQNHTDAVRSRMKAEQGKSFSTAALSKQK